MSAHSQCLAKYDTVRISQRMVFGAILLRIYLSKTCKLRWLHAHDGIMKFIRFLFRFRYILSQETTKPNSHRSLVAIKEHGVLISTINDADEQIEFWAIGYDKFIT